MVVYAARVEELFSQVVELHALQRPQQVLLKGVFNEDLHTDLKIASSYKYGRIVDYMFLITEIRKFEEEVKRSRAKSDVKPKNNM